MNVNRPNETTKLFDYCNTFFYIVGLKYFWISDVALSQRFIKMYKIIEYLIIIVNIFFPVSILGSFFTQKNLTVQQSCDQLIFGITLPGNSLFNVFLLFYKVEIRELLYNLAVVLKEHQNDPELEREMIKKIKVFSIALGSLVCTVIVSYGLIALFRVITAGEIFTTIIPAWPDVLDTSMAAGVMRVVFYICWYIFGVTNMATYSLLVTLMLTICYQFKNLQKYFYSLDSIFDDKTLCQAEKEIKYEQAFKIGIQMHAHTLWCKMRHQYVCKEVFGTEAILFFGIFLSQLTTLLGSEHNLAELWTTLVISLTIMIGLGFFMWNGGDITVEASKLSDAIYSSGWENCYGQSSFRIRKLVVNAMRQAQEPVVYKTLGVVDLSYEAYVTLVKMPYTAVSVFY